MKITVLMSSGDEDEWEDVEDALEENGSLFILAPAPDEIPADAKTMTIVHDLEGGAQKGRTFLLSAQYAPSMWMRVIYDA